MDQTASDVCLMQQAWVSILLRSLNSVRLQPFSRDNFYQDQTDTAI